MQILIIIIFWTIQSDPILSDLLSYRKRTSNTGARCAKSSESCAGEHDKFVNMSVTLMDNNDDDIYFVGCRELINIFAVVNTLFV